MPSLNLLLGAGIFLVTAVVYLRSNAANTSTSATKDGSSAQEPPPAPTSVPIIGHVLGTMRSKFNYLVQLSQKFPHDIFTISMLGQKMYVVATPDMIQAVQKQPKTFAFPPIQAKFSRAICGVSDHAHEILMKNLNGDEGDWGLAVDSHATFQDSLKPGPALDAMNRIMIENFDACLSDLEPVSPGGSKTIQLVAWLRRCVTLATTNSVYGPQNPYKDQKVADAFWAFEADMLTIMLGFIPTWLAPKGIAGRAVVSSAFEKYFLAKGHESGSSLIQRRYAISIKNGLSVADFARYEVGGSVAVLVNTAPAIFWTLFFVYSHPSLLADVRAEIQPLIKVETDAGTGAITRRVDVTNLKLHCPLLVSALQETLRFRAMGTSVRQVMRDSTLLGRWRLSRGAMIQMPSRVIHLDQRTWGASAAEFEPRRFMKETRAAAGKRPSPAAFRAFGGGSTLCPGRHFATNETLVVVVMFALRFDMKPAGGAKEWRMPTADKTNVAAVIMEPDTDIEVEVTPREGLGDGKWVFSLEDSDKVVAMVAEDQ